MWGGIVTIVSSVIGYFFDSPDVKKAKEEGRVEIEKLKLTIKKESLMAAAVAESDYDRKAMDNMKTSWKDEYLIILHTFPIWGYGIPSDSLHQGLDRIWLQFNNADYFWWITYMGIIASTFGLRWLFSGKIQKMMEMKGK